jgi:hypothetical protein
MGLRFFLALALVEALGFFFPLGPEAADAFLAPGSFTDAVCLEAVLSGARLAGGLATVGDELDWATAGSSEQGQSRKKIPAKTATAKRRTQTLPTAGSCHP